MNNITYDQLLEIISWGVFTKEMKGSCIKDSELVDVMELRTKMKGAYHRGVYVGSPGADIFYFLPYLSEDQMREVAKMLGDLFPKVPLHQHVQTSACIRQIYGLFIKEGILLSDKRMKQMANSDLEWSLPRKFLGILCKEFKKIKNYYGLCIVYEMDGHRYGDEAVLKKSKDKLELMRQSYEMSVKYAFKCNCKKQIFTPYYWGAKYYDKYGDKKRAVEWYSLMIENFNEKGAKRRGVYLVKLTDAVNRIRKLDIEKFRSIHDFYIVGNNLKDHRKSLRKALQKSSDKVE